MDWEKGLEWIQSKKGLFLFIGFIIMSTVVVLAFVFSKLLQPSPLTSYSLLGASNEPSVEMATEVMAESEMSSEAVLSHIYVDIKGAVQRPGVYQLEEGSRLFDLIDLAGGLTLDAYQEGINLAQQLEDQMMVRIYPRKEVEAYMSAQEDTLLEVPDTGITIPSITLSQSDNLVEENSNSLININTASSIELESLPNIGPKKAHDIILYRETNGSFQEIEELLNVSGIGSKTFASLEDLITVNP